jgi:hypothetical protein
MGCCDYCCDGAIKFCSLCDTHEGNMLHWEYVTLWGLEGCFPCEYQYPSYEWKARSEKWFIDQMQSHAVFIEWEDIL